MNYAEARQRTTGLWDWTTMRDKTVHRSLPCTEDCTHRTEKEACRHFYEYCLAQVKEHEYIDEQHRCMICGEWTNKSFGNRQFWLSIRPVDLCDKHINIKSLVEISPFTYPIRIIHS